MTTREERLKSCRRCTARTLDPQQGLVCSLTGRYADFEGVCPVFSLDAAEADRVNKQDKEASEGDLSPSDKVMLKLFGKDKIRPAAMFFLPAIMSLLEILIYVSTGVLLGFGSGIADVCAILFAGTMMPVLVAGNAAMAAVWVLIYVWAGRRGSGKTYMAGIALLTVDTLFLIPVAMVYGSVWGMFFARIPVIFSFYLMYKPELMKKLTGRPD